MSKRTVQYRGDAVAVGHHAMLVPVDHPDTMRVSNTREVMTSRVVEWDEATGRIETQNTIYVREGTK